MWTDQDREKYKDDGRRYPSDLTDAEWDIIEPLFPGQYIIGTQEYGRFNLKKGMSFGLHKRAFLKSLDGIRQRATLSLS
jgi:hypothetical protein